MARRRSLGAPRSAPCRHRLEPRGGAASGRPALRIRDPGRSLRAPSCSVADAPIRARSRPLVEPSAPRGRTDRGRGHPAAKHGSHDRVRLCPLRRHRRVDLPPLRRTRQRQLVRFDLSLSHVQWARATEVHAVRRLRRSPRRSFDLGAARLARGSAVLRLRRATPGRDLRRAPRGRRRMAGTSASRSKTHPRCPRSGRVSQPRPVTAAPGAGSRNDGPSWHSRRSAPPRADPGGAPAGGARSAPCQRHADPCLGRSRSGPSEPPAALLAWATAAVSRALSGCLGPPRSGERVTPVFARDAKHHVPGRIGDRRRLGGHEHAADLPHRPPRADVVLAHDEVHRVHEREGVP